MDIPEIKADYIAFRTPEELNQHLSALDLPLEKIGASRNGQPLYAYTMGTGATHVSIIAGSHADEPVGPMTAQALPQLLRAYRPDLLKAFTFYVVPQMNPDGADRNRPWFDVNPDFETYAAHAFRELPGDDIEFGFGEGDSIRPENRAAMDFLRAHAPCAAHFSLHGMGFAEGAWFLLHPDWVQRAQPLIDKLTVRCREEGMPFHDIDRKGDKGFTRICEGWCTTPDSGAMRDFFHRENDPDMAAKFHPSSMEFVHNLGGDTLCMVSEMPLFLLTRGESSLEDPIFLRFRDDLKAATGNPDAIRELIKKYGIQTVPIAQQMQFQFHMICDALDLLTATP
jgi:hypothetical protein